MAANLSFGQPIVIADYDPAWPDRFAAERDLVYEACTRDAFIRIEHIGSTSVVGLAAKPIIDMMPGLRSLDDATVIIPQLEQLGFVYVPQYERDTPSGPGMPFRRYFRKDRDGTRAFHVHMVEHGSDFWQKQLLFRDYLRAFPQEAEAYADLKRKLAARFNANLTPLSDSNVGYTDFKTEFVARCLDQARELLAAGKLPSGD